MRISILNTRAMFAGLTCLSLAALAAEPVVVAGSGSAIGSLSKDQVSDLFLGKTSALPGGGKAALVDLPESSPLRDAFYSKVTGKSAAQVRSTWAKLSFTGKGVPPAEAAGPDEVKKQVAGNKAMLGYIDKSAVDGSVKVVFAP